MVSLLVELTAKEISSICFSRLLTCSTPSVPSSFVLIPHRFKAFSALPLPRVTNMDFNAWPISLPLRAVVRTPVSTRLVKKEKLTPACAAEAPATWIACEISCPDAAPLCAALVQISMISEERVSNLLVSSVCKFHCDIAASKPFVASSMENASATAIFAACFVNKAVFVTPFSPCPYIRPILLAESKTSSVLIPNCFAVPTNCSMAAFIFLICVATSPYCLLSSMPSI